MTSLVCQPCQNDEIEAEATGYCIDCGEYLCATCYKYHCKPQPCRNHVLLDKESMPREPVSNMQMDTCDKHKGKALEYFCNVHDYVGCSVCMTLDHTSCEGKSYIPEIANYLPDSNEYKELQTDINGLSKYADEKISVINDSINGAEKRHDAMVADILCFREELEEAINALANVVRDDAQIIKEKHNKKEKERIKACEDVKSEIERISSELNMAIRYRQFLKLFIAMRSGMAATAGIHRRLKDVELNEEIQFEFTPNLSILKLLNALETLGTVSAIRPDKTTVTQLVKTDYIETESLKRSHDQTLYVNPTNPTTKSILKSQSEGELDPSKIADHSTIDNTLNTQINDTDATAKTDKIQLEQHRETCSISFESDDISKVEQQGLDCLAIAETEGQIEAITQQRKGIGNYMLPHSDDEDEEELVTKIPEEPSVTDAITKVDAGQETANFDKVLENGATDSNPKASENVTASKDNTKGDIPNHKDVDSVKLENIAPQAKISNPKERVVVFLKDIAVTSLDDTSVPTISGMASLSGDQIVVCDSENKSVKVVDVLTNIVLQTIKSEQSPWDVCESGPDKLAVTFPFSKQITIYAMSQESFKKERSFSVGGGCYGIAYANDNLFVAFGDADVVKVMDLYGHTLRTLQNARGEKCIFSGPKHITTGPEGRLFYVANWGNASVTCLTALGHVAGIFTDRELKAPRGVAVDSFGLVYICNYPRPSCIQVLTKGLNKVKKLLNKDKTVVNPLSLAYSATGDWLFIGVRGENVKMYKLTV